MNKNRDTSFMKNVEWECPNCGTINKEDKVNFVVWCPSCNHNISSENLGKHIVSTEVKSNE